MPKMPKMMPEQEVVMGARFPTAGAGRGRINPRPVNVSEEDYVSPSDRMRMAEQLGEDRMLRASEREYNKLMPKGMAKGGSASSRADGIAQRGKTRGTMVACGGGYMKGGK
jgi:hypothetical protein